MKACEIIEKRKRRWAERGDIEYDRLIVEAAAKYILTDSELREEIIRTPYLLIECCFVIVDKKRRTVPFFLNKVQKEFINELETKDRSKPFCILKGRQQGFTSLITAIQLCYAIVMKNFAGFTMADRSDNTQAIFNDKARVTYQRLPEILKPSEKFNSRNEMFFDKLNSSWRIATASDEVGRSRTLNFVHFSEVAFYTCSLERLQTGIGEAIAEGAIWIYETTANGFNQFKELWDSGSCHNLFYAWWETDEYRSCEYQYLETNDTWLIERLELLGSRGLDKEQLTWYAKKYASYLDKSLIRQEYPCTPEEAFLTSGHSIFDMEAITNRLASLTGSEVLRTGYFEYDRVAHTPRDSRGITSSDDIEYRLENIRWVDDKGGYIRIHEEPQAKRDAYGQTVGLAPYALGGDTAGDGEDYFTAKVINNMTDRTAATLRIQKIDEDVYAEQIYCLGKYYNTAKVGVEINYSEYPTKVLAHVYSYPNLYMRERIGVNDKITLEPGFETTKKSKRNILSELVKLFRKKPEIECDRETLLEMSVFVKKDGGEQEAVDGFHDDLVMALAIAHRVGTQTPTDWLEPENQDDEGRRFIEENFSLTDELASTFDSIGWDTL